MPKIAPRPNLSVIREVVEVTGGVDTHADTHTVAALDQLGGLLGTATFPATGPGYQHLLDWLGGHGPLGRVGVEGTGSYGAGLARHLSAAQQAVVEVNRPNRADRRARGKSDPQDAINAARAVLAGTATATPKTRDGVVEAVRVVQTTRRGAVKARSAALGQFISLLVTAPEAVRAMLRPLTVRGQITAAAGFRPQNLTDPSQAAKTALKRLARRVQFLDEEIAAADADLQQLTQHAAPDLRGLFGVGPDAAAQLLVTAGDNPDRLHSEASFAALCGTSPVPASSGKTVRYRLNRGGDRQANRALHMIMLTRIRAHQPTRDYVQRALARGKTKRDVMRQLKRYLARTVYLTLTLPPTTIDLPEPKLPTAA